MAQWTTKRILLETSLRNKERNEEIRKRRKLTNIFWRVKSWTWKAIDLTPCKLIAEQTGKQNHNFAPTRDWEEYRTISEKMSRWYTKVAGKNWIQTSLERHVSIWRKPLSRIRCDKAKKKVKNCSMSKESFNMYLKFNRYNGNSFLTKWQEFRVKFKSIYLVVLHNVIL